MNRDINLDEILNSEDVDLSSFIIKDHLDPKIWDLKNGTYVLKPKIRQRLMVLADDFYDSLDLDFVDIKDIIFTGSLANYNWSNFSDIDLHIVLDFVEVDKNEDLVKGFFNARKAAWNDEHDVKILGYDVEVYVQDRKEKHFSTGVYSILRNKWLLKPSRDQKIENKEFIRKKSSDFMNLIDSLDSFYEKGYYNYLIKKIDRIKEKIKNMRQEGLESKGEFSKENLIFKVLRRTGYIEKLYDLQTKAYDKAFSL
jgi:hypothetical protein